jgi:hypothetical protein
MITMGKAGAKRRIILGFVIIGKIRIAGSLEFKLRIGIELKGVSTRTIAQENRDARARVFFVMRPPHNAASASGRFES